MQKEQALIQKVPSVLNAKYLLEVVARLDRSFVIRHIAGARTEEGHEERKQIKLPFTTINHA